MALRDLTAWRSAAPARHPDLWQPFGSFRAEFDRLFDDFFRDFGAPALRDEPAAGSYLSPRLDVAETDKAYEIAVELPGIGEKDVDVTLADGVLTIKGEKKAEFERKDGGQLHVERRYGSFHRSLALPENADAEKIDARFENGVLRIAVAKRPEAKTEVRRIEVKGRK